VNERSSSIDGLPVGCVGDILGTDMPPPPFHLYCQNDGRACTIPFNTPNNTTGIGCSAAPATGGLGSAASLVCALEVNSDQGVQVADFGDLMGVAFNPSNLSFTGTGRGGCIGDALTPVGQRSCYAERCDGSGGCASAQDDNLCAGVLPNEACGGAAVCRGNAGPPPGGATGPMINMGSWGPTNVSERDGMPIVGCVRPNACWVPEFSDFYEGCWPHLGSHPNLCLACYAEISPEGELSLRGEGACGPRDPSGGACSFCNASAECEFITPAPRGCNPQ
jgi:hypothetical protein